MDYKLFQMKIFHQTLVVTLKSDLGYNLKNTYKQHIY